MEVFRCLIDAGNILAKDNKTPLFEFEDKGSYSGVKGSFADFKKKYGTLHPAVTLSMLRAVYSMNPGWNWIQGKDCPHCKGIGRIIESGEA